MKFKHIRRKKKVKSIAFLIYDKIIYQETKYSPTLQLGEIKARRNLVKKISSRFITPNLSNDQNKPKKGHTKIVN